MKIIPVARPLENLLFCQLLVQETIGGSGEGGVLKNFHIPSCQGLVAHQGMDQPAVGNESQVGSGGVEASVDLKKGGDQVGARFLLLF